MIVRLKKIEDTEKRVIYRYSPEENKKLDGEIGIDKQEKSFLLIEPVSNDQNFWFAKRVAPHIVGWYEEGKLPEEYTVCIG